MIGEWFIRYRTLMGRTSLVSKIGSFLMLVLAISEGINVVRGISTAEDLGHEAVVGASFPVLSYFVVFGARFYLLHRFPSSTGINLISWWITAIAVYVCAEPNPHLHGLTLEWAGIFFILFSSLRFLITASIAFSNDK